MFCGVVILNITTDFTSHSTGYQNHSHATARGSNPGRNGVFIELHVLRKGQ